MRRRVWRSIFFAGCMLSAAALAHAGTNDGLSAARAIPIQHGGQVKSFDSFARQTLEAIAQKETWERKPAVLVFLEALSKPEAIADIRWIKINNNALTALLDLPAREKNLFSLNDIEPHLDRLRVLILSARDKRDHDLKPSVTELKAEALDNAVFEVKSLISGESVKVVPPGKGESWLTMREAGSADVTPSFSELLSLFREKNMPAFSERTKARNEAVHQKTGNVYRQKIALEVLYLGLRPFQQAWLLYFAAFIVFLFRKTRPRLRTVGGCLAAAAYIFHTSGLVLRVLILARPPVSNMYESMIFMDWVLMTTAFVFSWTRKSLTAASAASLVTAVILIYGNLLPIDTSLDILVPVLRSNYWLTVHVLTIVSSYGVFALAMGLGHRQLILGLRGKLSKAEEKRSGQAIYRVMQVGLLLLGIGTVLGGVWANESWGRFWGWDPKETWALITFLGYLVIVHLKLTNAVDDFMLAVCSILGFFFVLMTWYGVNFVLGRGLHSYGFSSGGMVWVVAYLIAEFVFVFVVLFKRLAR